jgi:S-adenosylmethionine synthetase
VSDHAFTFVSESVSEGHPDKVADLISDSVLDAALAGDPDSRVACETLCKGGRVIVAGEITSRAALDLEGLVRGAVRSVGYIDDDEPFSADRLQVTSLIGLQAREIGEGVTSAADDPATLGAGDQGMMFGYASDETETLMPLPIHLAHRITEQLARDRHAGRIGWLRPDAKSQVGVRYESGRPVGVRQVLVSTQHAPSAGRREIESYVRDDLLPGVLGPWHAPGIEVLVNPAGPFTEGGPSADCGLTGRKIIADTYGGMARHGGGAFSGKDGTKVDRSAAYFCRHVARQLVRRGLARRAEVQVAYAIGRARPLSLLVETFGTGDAAEATAFAETLDLRPEAIIKALDLRSPRFAATTNYGHFGRPGLPWEADGP